MSAAALRRLQAANPVSEPPELESPERLRGLIEQEPLPARARTGPARPPRRGAWRLTAGALLLLAVVAGGLLLEGDPGPRRLGVLASAYAATAPRGEVIEAVVVARRLHGAPPSELRERDWLDGTTGQTREVDLRMGPHGPAQIRDAVLSATETQEWRLPQSPGEILVERFPAGSTEAELARLQMRLRGMAQEVVYGGFAMYGLKGLQSLRQLLHHGLVRLEGKARVEGRLLWKLVGPPLQAGQGPPGVRLVVLVDPRSFLPLVERRVSRHGTILDELRLRAFRRLPATTATQRIFQLTLQHPRARERQVAPARPQPPRAGARPARSSAGSARRADLP